MRSTRLRVASALATAAAICAVCCEVMWPRAGALPATTEQVVCSSVSSRRNRASAARPAASCSTWRSACMRGVRSPAARTGSAVASARALLTSFREVRTSVTIFPRRDHRASARARNTPMDATVPVRAPQIANTVVTFRAGLPHRAARRPYGTTVRDVDIREGLSRKLRKEFRGDPLRNELGICLGETRVDLVVVNCALHGYEIKSARDRLDRLPRQVEIYSRVLDYCTLVIETRVVDRALSAVPPWWGISEAYALADGQVGFRTVRVAAKNQTVDAFSLCQLLWRDEAASLLEVRGEHVRRRETRWNLWDRLAEIPLQELQELVRTTLKRRDWPPSA